MSLMAHYGFVGTRIKDPTAEGVSIFGEAGRRGDGAVPSLGDLFVVS